jgi:hypothetical protein
MPGNVSGQSGDPSCGDSGEWIRDTLARVENGQAVLTAAIAELATQFAELSRRIAGAEDEAEAILRRAASPAPARHAAPPPRRRRSDTFLTVVKTVAAIGACLAALIALTAPTRARVQHYSPRPVAHHATPGPPRGR